MITRHVTQSNHHGPLPPRPSERLVYPPIRLCPSAAHTKSTTSNTPSLVFRPPPGQWFQRNASTPQHKHSDAVRLAIDDERLAGIKLWADLARRLPPPYSAAPLFLAAWRSYRDGNGALANIANDLSLAADPGYTGGPQANAYAPATPIGGAGTLVAVAAFIRGIPA